MKFEPYPFEKLRKLIADIKPDSKYFPVDLTIGEPKFDTPIFIQDALKNSTKYLNKYPKSAGEEILKDSILSFVKKRFAIDLKPNEVIPTLGTREVLFNFPQFLLFDKKNPKMAFTNPFYQIYEGASIASRADVVHLNLTKKNDFKPDICDERLKKCDLVILNFPNNPTASTLSLDELCKWVELALKYDFVLLNDECYSEIYLNEPPCSILEASKLVGNEKFKNILAINSISKRSSAPSLRSGFIAGDSKILKDYLVYRTYLGCAMPIPMQYASAVAWNDENHVELARFEYRRNFELAKEILGVTPSEATFYIWLEVDDELVFTKELYEKYNVLVLPGSFLGRGGIGTGYVRIALVENEFNTKEALTRIQEFRNK